jgi:hypothetical protein
MHLIEPANGGDGAGGYSRIERSNVYTKGMVLR